MGFFYELNIFFFRVDLRFFFNMEWFVGVGGGVGGGE